MKGKIEKIVNRIFHLEVEGHGKDNPILLRLTQTQEFTKVDFGYTTTNKYINGGWIKMAPDTYIEDTLTQKGISCSRLPELQFHPTNTISNHTKIGSITLYFEPLPQKTAPLI